MFNPSTVDPLTLPSLPLECRKALPKCAGSYKTTCQGAR
jgi:hypothetical protein